MNTNIINNPHVDWNEVVALRDTDSGKWVTGSPDGGINGNTLLFDTREEAAAVARQYCKDISDKRRYKRHLEEWRCGRLVRLVTK